MIFKIKFSDKTEFAQAKNHLHLLQNYHQEYDNLMDIEEITEISDEDAKNIMLKNNEYNEELPDSDDNYSEFSLYATVVGDDFVVVGSTEWD